MQDQQIIASAGVSGHTLMAERFSCAAWVLVGFVLPILMVPSNRSSPACLVAAAACCLASVVLAGRFAQFADKLKALFLTPEAVVAGLFVVWCAVSIGWSPAPRPSWFAFGEVLLPVLAALVLVAGLGKPPTWFATLALVGLAITLCGLAFELRDGLVLRKLFSGREFAFTLNRPMVVALLVSIPLLEMLRRAGRNWRAAAIFVLLTIVIAMTASHSSKLGMLAALLALVATSFMPKLSLRLGLVVILVLLAMAPRVGNIARAILPAHTLDTVEEGHPRERVIIWETFGEVAMLRPFRGIGFNASPNAGNSSVEQEVTPERREVLKWGHPHNVFLQIWAELGLVGVVLTAIGIVLLFRRLATIPPAVLPYRLAAVAAIASIGVVSHGAWQGWWFAAIGAQVVLFLASTLLFGTASNEQRARSA